MSVRKAGEEGRLGTFRAVPGILLKNGVSTSYPGTSWSNDRGFHARRGRYIFAKIWVRPCYPVTLETIMMWLVMT